MKRLFLTAIVSLVFAIPTFAQSDTEHVVLPDAVMKQVVGRIVKWYFKPRSKPTTVYFADSDLKEIWLPSIPGIRFVLLDANRYHHGQHGYVISAVDRTERGYTIGFGSGKIGCPGLGQGDTWEFRLDGPRVRILPGRGSFGWGCDSSASSNPLKPTLSN